ncbi:MAG: hypothetical protein CMJ59_13450 [Planctomycetaceae bacterium]|nr:hypothetical protein [Planctomycetaceae bacterium]
MNKAFVREPEFDGRGYCPRCGALGIAVTSEALDNHISPRARPRIGDSAWFCSFAGCEVAYFTLLETVVEVGQLMAPVYPKDDSAPICACFGFGRVDVEADIRDGAPTRIRALLERTASPQADCQRQAADGRCCRGAVQRLYLQLTGQTEQ